MCIRDRRQLGVESQLHIMLPSSSAGKQATISWCFSCVHDGNRLWAQEFLSIKFLKYRGKSSPAFLRPPVLSWSALCTTGSGVNFVFAELDWHYGRCSRLLHSLAYRRRHTPQPARAHAPLSRGILSPFDFDVNRKRSLYFRPKGLQNRTQRQIHCFHCSKK